jgi:hypothetical protein
LRRYTLADFPFSLPNVELKVDVIVPLGGPSAQAAKKGNSTIPIVFMSGLDPHGQQTSGQVVNNDLLYLHLPARHRGLTDQNIAETVPDVYRSRKLGVERLTPVLPRSISCLFGLIDLCHNYLI